MPSISKCRSTAPPACARQIHLAARGEDSQLTSSVQGLRNLSRQVPAAALDDWQQLRGWLVSHRRHLPPRRNQGSYGGGHDGRSAQVAVGLVQLPLASS
jgi:hypothetical protein